MLLSNQTIERLNLMVLNILALLVQKYTCFTGTNVLLSNQTIERLNLNQTIERLNPIYLLYWYKSTNTDAESAATGLQHRRPGGRGASCVSRGA